MVDAADLVGTAVQWSKYKKDFEKEYSSQDEDSKRYQIWMNNTLHMMEQNMNTSHTFSLGWNAFTDLTEEEFAEFHLGYKPPANSTEAWGLPLIGEHRFDGDVNDLPSFWDWSLAGQSASRISVVTQVKDQGQCGSCWAFSTTGALEGAHSVANGIDAGKISMSEQQLLDCGGQGGCGGGSPARAMDWEKSTNVCQEQSYPYKGQRGQCQSQCTVILSRGSIEGHYSVGRNEGAHMSALIQRPLSVVVYAKGRFMNYRSGVLSGCQQGQTDHAILLVGYGTVNGQKFWKVKNSWGTRWGLSGFGLLGRGEGGMDSCAILSGTNGVYVYGKYNPPSQIYRDGKRVEPLGEAMISV